MYDSIGVLYVPPSLLPKVKPDSHCPLGTQRGNKPQELEQEMMEFFKVNAVANVHLFNLFMPLILKGRAKKVVAISSGSADLESVREFDIVNFPAYAMSKAALNVAVAKFSAQYRKYGVLFISICPGLVEAGHFADGMKPPFLQ
jgi:NAD(P)-dependent dehydrogenase (short-subunit alcohol dehydrogenase family)